MEQRPDLKESMELEDMLEGRGTHGTFRPADTYGKARLMDGSVPSASSAGGDQAAKALKAMGQSKFKRFVLYVRYGNGPSRKALDLLAQRPRMKSDAMIQDVDVLIERGLKPSWLVGVPMLVEHGRLVFDSRTKQMRQEAHRGFVGPDAMNRIRTWQTDEPIAKMGRKIQRGMRQGFSNGVKGTSGALFSTMAWHDVKGEPSHTGMVERQRALAKLSAGGKTADAAFNEWKKSREQQDALHKRMSSH